MTRFFNTTLTVQDFLDKYWQKKPLLIRQAFPGFRPELDINDIAGLACEEMAESRLVTGSYPDHNWTLQQGPFNEDDLTTLPDRDWTLLVQDVEKHYPPLQSLFDSFDFIPAWRFDDLMVSVAAPGGSVGPHTDQYDVFLLQASGRRRWQIATQFSAELLPDSELNVLKSFHPEQEWTLEAGDMLYLPPAIAHHGVALETGMTWSVGTRAPSTADLFQALGEWLALNANEGERFRDQGLSVPTSAGRVDNSALAGLREMLVKAVNDPGQFNNFIGSFLSRFRLAHEPAAPEHQVTSLAVKSALTDGAIIRHNPWTRMLWVPRQGQASLFAAGQAFECEQSTAEMICGNPLQAGNAAELSNETLNLVSELINLGHLYFEE